MKTSFRSLPGQSVAEVVLLLAMVILVILATVFVISWAVVKGFGGSQPSPEPAVQYAQACADLMETMAQFQGKNQRWPDNWQELGLDAQQWSLPQGGMLWSIDGDQVKMVNDSEDEVQFFLKGTQGKILHLYDGWPIICRVEERFCYYYSVAPENQVDLTTLWVEDSR